MKKTLLICGRYPLPEDHGSPIRTMNFVRFFLKHGPVDIAYSQVSTGARREDAFFSNEIFLKTREFGKDYKSRFLRLMKLRRTPLPVFDFSRDSEGSLLSLVEANDYDYILVRYLHNTSILFRLPQEYKTRTIIDFDDVVSGTLYDAMFESVKGLHKKVIVALNRKFLIDYEKSCLGFGASLFCSDNDRAGFMNNGRTGSVFVVPNVYANKSFEDYDFGDGSQNANTLLFVGALKYGPNVDGLKWFVEAIFPDFRQKYPDARLLVVGRSPDAEVRRICARVEQVELHADAPDIKQYYRRCKAVIVPLLAGGGTRIKILEAALANRPVLSTPLGAEGLDLVEETDLLLFNNGREFTTQYEKLFRDDTYHSLVQHVRQTVLSRYSAEKFNEAMEAVLDGLESVRHAPAAEDDNKDIHDRVTQ